MISPVALWPPIAGTVVLIAGLAVARRDLALNRGLAKWAAAAGPLFAAPLAVFGMQHMIVGQFIQSMVPPWMPWRLFWTYLVGVALIAAAVSIVLRRYARWSGTLVAVMIFLFVLMIHIPNVVKVPSNRIFWVVAIRDATFAAGGLLLAGITIKNQGGRNTGWMVLVGRVVIGVALVFFGVEHYLHPEFAPGVPLEKITPAWVPMARLCGYLVGSFVLVAGAGVLTGKMARLAAGWTGIVMLALTAFLYLPIYAMASGTAPLVEGVNYVADTMLFAGACLLLAKALDDEPSPQSRAALYTV